MTELSTTTADGVRTSGVPAPRPIWVGDSDHVAFGMLHEPDGVPRGCAVLICPPFGNSDNGSYMPRRTWAQHLAANGHPALRIDLPGMGDSPGSPHDPGIAEAWIAAIADAAAWLRAGYGLRVAAIGFGLGGLIACRAAERGAAIDDLALWAVPSRGRNFLRELRIFEAMLASRVYEPDGEGATNTTTESRDDGSMVSAGFVLSAESVQTIREIDVARLPEGAGAGHRVLLLDRDGIELEDRLSAAFVQWGAELEKADGSGFWRMMAAPYESEAPVEVIATVDEWLDRAPAGATAPAPETSPCARDRIETVSDGAKLREWPLEIERDAGRLLAIVTEPASMAPDPRLTLVLANSGTLRRVGPNRMWTELARRWAARGLRVVRFDLARESDLSPGILSRFHPAHARPGDMLWDHYVPGFERQYAAVLDTLAARDLGDRFVLAGLSSGAYWALDRIREDPRIAAAILINCSMLRWDETMQIESDVGKLRELSTWRRIMRREVPAERLLHASIAATRLLARAWTRRASSSPPVDELGLLLRRISDRGQQLTFLWGSGEPLRRELEASGRMAEVQAHPDVTVEFLQSSLTAHVLESVALQRDAHAVLDDAITRALAAADDAPVAAAAAAAAVSDPS